MSTLAAVDVAGRKLAERFSPHARPRDLNELRVMLDANEAVVASELMGTLRELHPAAGWIEDDEEEGELPDGAWWVVDLVEGNVNHVHGRPDWGVSAALVIGGAACRPQ